jgi:hypothetical protein
LSCDDSEQCVGLNYNNVLTTGRCSCDSDSECPQAQECETVSGADGDRCVCSQASECPSGSVCSSTNDGHCHY